MSRFAMSAGLMLILVGASGCSGLSGSMAEARRRVAAVRPDSDLSETRAELWHGVADFERALRREKELLSHSFVRKILDAQAPFLRRVGVLRDAEGEEVLARLTSDDPQWIAAFVVPTSDLVMVRPAYARSVHLLTHELGHIASWQQGYWDYLQWFASLRPDSRDDPAFISLDAFIACWALEEGVAEVTAMAASANAEGGKLDLAGERRRLRPHPPLNEPAMVVGPADAWINELHVVLGEGETFRVPAPFDQRVRDLAYGAARRFVLIRELDQQRPTESLEAHFAGLWDGFNGTTREILFALERSERSALASWCRHGGMDELTPRPDGATRLGTFVVFQVLSQTADFEVAAPLRRAGALRDDLALRWGDDRFLWLTDWRDAAAARDFANWAASHYPGARIGVNGARVTTSWNAPIESL